MKKTVISVIAIFLLLIGFAVLGTADSLFGADKTDDKYTLTQDNYEADDWSETVEYDGYTVTKHMTMGAPSVIVEFYHDEYPATVTITRGSKTTLIYSQDRFTYDMYISYKNDAYMIEDNFANLDEIVACAFDWSEDSYLGTYTEEYVIDENGNKLYMDEDGNIKVYSYADES